MRPAELSETLHREFFATFPHLRGDAVQATAWFPVQTLRINGRDATDTADPACAGLFLTREGKIVFYGGQWRLLRRVWLDYDKASLADAEFRYDIDPQCPYVFVDCRLKGGETRAQLRLPLLPDDPGFQFPIALPDFPALAASGKTQFALPARPVGVARSAADEFRTRNALVGISPEAMVLRAWNAEAPDDLLLRHADFLGTLRDDWDVAHAWWNGSEVRLVRFTGNELETLARSGAGQLPAPVLDGTAVAGRPVITELRGLIAGSLIPRQTCLCLPLASRGSLMVVDGARRPNVVAASASAHVVNSSLVLICEKSNTAVAIEEQGTPAQELATRLKLQTASYPAAANEYIMFLEAAAKTRADRSCDFPALLVQEGPRFTSRISPWPVDVESFKIDRVEEGRYWINTPEGAVLTATVDAADDLRLRQFVLHTRVLERMRHDDRMAALYGLLNELRVRRFMHLLYGDLLLLYQEMEKSPRPGEILKQLDDEESLDRRATKQVCELLLPKMLLLAQSLPELKRNLEKLGIFYPYHVRGWDEAWLREAFGEGVASQWGTANGHAQVDRLRGFVRGTQASLWRSLAEIERALSRLEPVYSEKLRSARTRATNRQYGMASAIGLTGLIATGQWYLPAIASLNLVTALVSSLESNQQHQALLMEHGREVLEWWSVFVDAFCVQVRESRRYLVGYFDAQSKRDCEIYKKLSATKPEALLENLKRALHDRIRSESAERFERIWEGAPQIRQDLIETLDQIVVSNSTPQLP